MRVNLITEATGPFQPFSASVPLTVTIKPSCGLPGDHLYPTDSASMLRMLRKTTDLSASVLDRWLLEIRTCAKSKLLGVDLDEKTLTDIGYFID